jgi:hypothetical protein
VSQHRKWRPRDRKCRCGKIPFYSEEAAAYALGTAQTRKVLDSRRREKRFYECRPGVWHLTSMTEEQRMRRARLWALCALEQWARPASGSYTVRVRPGCRLPNPHLVRVIVKVARGTSTTL